MNNPVKLNVTTDVVGRVLVHLDDKMYSITTDEAVRLAMKLLIAEQEVLTRNSSLDWEPND